MPHFTTVATRAFRMKVQKSRLRPFDDMRNPEDERSERLGFREKGLIVVFQRPSGQPRLFFASFFWAMQKKEDISWVKYKLKNSAQSSIQVLPHPLRLTPIASKLLGYTRLSP